MEVMKEVISLACEYELLNKEGLLILEYSFDKLEEKYPNLKQIKHKKYGHKFITIYKKI